MDLRKIISFGNSSYVVSLPKGWIVKNRIKKGDVLEVEEKPTELVLSLQDKGRRREIKEMVVECQNRSDDILKAEIVSAYINNYDIIRVIGIEKEDRHAEIKKVFNMLIGMEIVEESAAQIVAKDLLDVTEVSLDKIIRRADMLIRAIYDEALLSKKPKDVTGRDFEVNCQAFLGYRMVRCAFDNPRIAKAFGMSYVEFMNAERVLMNLEHFADNIKRMSRIMLGVDQKMREQFRGLYKLIYEKYLMAMKVYYSGDKEESFRRQVEIKRLFGESEKPLKRCKDINCARLVEHLKGMVDELATILRCVTDHV